LHERLLPHFGLAISFLLVSQTRKIQNGLQKNTATEQSNQLVKANQIRQPSVEFSIDGAPKSSSSTLIFSACHILGPGGAGICSSRRCIAISIRSCSVLPASIRPINCTSDWNRIRRR